MFDLTVETPSYPEDNQLRAAHVFLEDAWHLQLSGRLKGKRDFQVALGSPLLDYVSLLG